MITKPGEALIEAFSLIVKFLRRFVASSSGSPHERREEDGDGGEVAHNTDTADQGQQRVAAETRSPANTHYPAIVKRYEASPPQLVICPTDCSWLEASIL